MSRVRLTARGPELERISEMLATVRDGEGAVTIVEGRAGFGMSRLLQVKGASHVVMISRPEVTTDLILDAARSIR